MWAESQNFNQSQELQQIPRISQALVVLDPDLDLEDWHPHPELNAVLQRRQDPDTPKGLQSTIAGKAVVRSLFCHTIPTVNGRNSKLAIVILII
jgi:hypothetical protein